MMIFKSLKPVLQESVKSKGRNWKLFVEVCEALINEVETSKSFQSCSRFLLVSYRVHVDSKECLFFFGNLRISGRLR